MFDIDKNILRIDKNIVHFITTTTTKSIHNYIIHSIYIPFSPYKNTQKYINETQAIATKIYVMERIN